MGYNRGGTRRTARLKRRKRLEQRLAEREAASAKPEKPSLTQKVKEIAKEAVEKVGDVLHAAAEKVKGTGK
jgi:hypothetical protein